MGIQSTSQITTNQLVATFDFLEPQQINMLYQQHGDQFFSTYQIIRSLGREDQVSASTWWAWEDQNIIENFTAVTLVAGGTTGTLTIGAVGVDVSAAGFSYPRNGDVIQVVQTGQKLRLSAKAVTAPPAFTTTFTASTLDATSVISPIVGTSMCFIYSSANATGTGPKDPATSGAVKRTFYTQIFKERISATGGVLADATRITQLERGGQIIGYHSMDTWGMEMRLAAAEDGAYWIGDESLLTEQSAMTTAVSLNPIFMTRGLFPTALLLGTTYNHGNTWTGAAFDTVIKAMVRQRVTSPYILGIQGLDLDTYIQNYLFTANLNTSVDFTKMTRNLFDGDEDLAMSVNFNTYTKGAHTFCWKMNANFSNPQTFGTSGAGAAFDYEKMGVWMPLFKYNDPTTGQSTGNIHVRYKGLGTYNRRLRMYTISGAGETNTYLSDIDGTNSYGMKEAGIGIVKSNQLVYLTT